MTNKIDTLTILAGLRVWFETYVSLFVSDDPIFQENIDLKVGHTCRVCEAILDIGGSLNLSMEEICLAETSALLHDIGRFEQYSRYRTFSDYRSEDHAELGVKVIKANRILNGFKPAEAGIILRVIGYHNRAALPVGEDERCLFFLKLLRDADKVDIWHVVTDYYQNAGNNRNRTIELDLPDIDQISDPVYNALMKGELAQMADLKTLNDFKSLQIGWIYDVNFPRTLQIIREKRYLEKIRGALPQKSVRAEEIYRKARAYLERNSSNLFIP
jgi:HD superfamily phosphodiesterase